MDTVIAAGIILFMAVSRLTVMYIALAIVSDRNNNWYEENEDEH